MGPLNNEATAAKFDRHIADAVADGARVCCGGRRAAGFPTGLYAEPTVLDGVTPGMAIEREETFGPVVPVVEVDSAARALELTNASPYGLTAAVFTSGPGARPGLRRAGPGRLGEHQRLDQPVGVAPAVRRPVRQHQRPRPGRRALSDGYLHRAEDDRLPSPAIPQLTGIPQRTQTPERWPKAMTMPTALEIARQAALKPIADIAAEIGIPPWLIQPYGEHVAKIDLAAIEALAGRPKAKYVVVTAVTPTPLGEGKTTTTVGLGQAMQVIGKRATIAIRQASMGPTFGIKGGAAGGGYSQAVPFEALNLHLTGDMHAVTAAHNMLSAMLDNHLHQGNALGLDLRNITWRRVLDVNDRALRNIVIGLGPAQDGLARQTGFDITAASEAMAVLALSVVAAGHAGAAGPDRGRLHRRRRAGHRRAAQGGRRDDRDHAGRDQAEPAADPGEHPRPGARRPVREHRARQLVGGGRPDRHPDRRLPDHRGRVRRGHGRGALLQHQVPGIRARRRTPRSWSPRCAR